MARPMRAMRARACVRAASRCARGDRASRRRRRPRRSRSSARNAEDPAHCGRLVEARQLHAPAGARDARRRRAAHRAAAVRLDDVPRRGEHHGAQNVRRVGLPRANQRVVLFTTDGDRTRLLAGAARAAAAKYRAAGRAGAVARTASASSTADFCAQSCDNEVAVWRVTRGGVRKELAWRRDDAWTDAGVAWKDADTLAIEYTRAGDRERARSNAGSATRRGPRVALTPRAAGSRWTGRAPARDDATDTASPDASRAIRSFVLRAGTDVAAQQRACDELLPRYGVAYARAPLDLERRIRPPRAGRARDRLRHGRDDGGHRRGAARTSISSASRCTCPASARCCAASTRRSSTNVRVVRARCGGVVAHDRAARRSPASTSTFPIRGRRSATTSAGCCSRRSCTRSPQRLAPGGYLHVATDWEPYADEILATLDGRAAAAQHRRRLRAAPRVAAADQVRAARNRARPRACSTCVFSGATRRTRSAMSTVGAAFTRTLRSRTRFADAISRVIAAARDVAREMALDVVAAARRQPLPQRLVVVGAQRSPRRTPRGSSATSTSSPGAGACLRSTATSRPPAGRGSSPG